MNIKESIKSIQRATQITREGLPLETLLIHKHALTKDWKSACDKVDVNSQFYIYHQLKGIELIISKK